MLSAVAQVSGTCLGPACDFSGPISGYVMRYNAAMDKIATLRCIVEGRNNIPQGLLRSCSSLESPSTAAILDMHEAIKAMLNSTLDNYQPETAIIILEALVSDELSSEKRDSQTTRWNLLDVYP